ERRRTSAEIREGVAEHLPPLPEGGAHDRPEVRLVGAHVDARLRAPTDVDDRRVDVRRWQEAPTRHAERDSHLAERLEDDGRHAVGVGAWSGGESKSHLPLEHDDRVREVCAHVEEAKEDGSRDVVREVADDRRRRGDELRERQLAHVADDDCDARVVGVPLLEARREPAVDLHEDEPAGPRGELVREGAEAGTDLEHPRRVLRACELDDPMRHPAIAEEVLAPATVRAQAGGRERVPRLAPRAHQAAQGTPKGSAASALTARPSSAPNEGRGKTTSTPSADAASVIRSRRRRFADTPPDTTRRGTPVTSSASIVVSISMSTSASWRLAVTSGSVSDVAGCAWRYSRSAVLNPLKLKSKRPRFRCARGKRTAAGSPSRASRSMTGPPG